MNDHRLCVRCNTQKPLTFEHFHWNKYDFNKICRSCLDKQRHNADVRKTIQLQKVEYQLQRAELFRKSIRYYETGDEQYYDEQIVPYTGGRDKTNLLQFLKQQLEQITPYLEEYG